MTEQKEYVVLVDPQDNEIGQMEKMEAHEKALLHRAFSIFLFNSKNELLIHRRAHSKYHSGGLWTNTCCSHPRVGESLEDATKRRLAEEMGMECQMEPVFNFIYKAELDHGLTEHELDHVFVGHTDEAPLPEPSEVAEVRYVSMDELKRAMNTHPDEFTEWFKIAYHRVEEFLMEREAVSLT